MTLTVTGGPSTAITWFGIVLLGAFSMTLAFPAMFVVLVPVAVVLALLSPIHERTIRRLWPGVRELSELSLPIAGVVGWVWGYLVLSRRMIGADNHRVQALLLPTTDRYIGTCIVLLLVAVASCSAWILAKRFRLDPKLSVAGTSLSRSIASPHARGAVVSSGLIGLPSAATEQTPDPSRGSPAIVQRMDGEPDEETQSNPIVAWRAWRWEGGALRGVRVTWEGPELEAECETCHESPGWFCTCGIYAFKGSPNLGSDHSTAWVWGKVELTGLVVEHDRGYRASHARIVDLWTDVGPEAARAIALKYGVPVHEVPMSGSKKARPTSKGVQYSVPGHVVGGSEPESWKVARKARLGDAIGAKYPATCSWCGQRIRQGDQVVPVFLGGRKRWVHMRCAGPRPNSAGR
jgi:hypothetical protein